MVIFGHGSFTFENLNGNSFLIILISSEDLRFLGRINWRSGDNVTHDTSDSFYSEREGGSIDQDQWVFNSIFTTNDTTLNGSTESDSLIGVDTSVKFFSEEFFNELSDFRNTGRTTNENDFVDFTFLKVGIFKSSSYGNQGLCEEIAVKIFEFSSGQSFIDI